jgi:hypothetical protein
MSLIELKDVRDMFYRGPALVLGPGITTYPTVEQDCLTKLTQEFPKVAKTPQHYYDFAEQVASEPQSKDLRKIVTEFFRSTKPHPQLDRIVGTRWTAIVSLTADGHFADALRNHLDQKPVGWTITKVPDTSVLMDPKSIPIYELLGDLDSTVEDSRLAVLRSEYLARRRRWSKLLRGFPDFVKGDPVLFVGTSFIVPLVCDFVNELLALAPAAPRRFIFLADDPTAANPSFVGLVKAYCQIDTVNCSVAEFCEMAAQGRQKTAAQLAPVTGSEPFDPTKLYGVEDQIAYVPCKFPEIAVKDQKHRLLDILFSPTNLDWSPYAANLDFKREITLQIEKSVVSRFGISRDIHNSCVVIRGEAGAGKTVLMRRVAIDLALGGYLSIWIRYGYGIIPGTRFDATIRAIEEAIQGRKARVVIFYDDPFGSRISHREVLTALTHAKFEWVLVFGFRNSDLINADGQEGSFYSKCDSFEVPTDFGPEEAQRLPDYLVSLDAAKDQQEAKALLSTLSLRDMQGNLFRDPSQNLFHDGKDILCMLWYLLPQTRAAISGSLTNEYLRLGGIGGAVRKYADASMDKQGIARLAYELVTTTSGLGTALPVEVLVAALGISYEQWISMCSEKKPLWGLLYTERYPEADTYGFRTRNHVVTKILLSILNGGSPGHAGEFRCLKQLISACTSSNSQYREFLCDMLIRRKIELSKRLSYEQGLELYDLAQSSFPLPDRTIAHHRALWIKDVGNLPVEAYEALQEVQRVPIYPHANRTEPIEHIHTSMAACALQAVSQQKIPLLPGVELVHQHIAQASTPNFFDLYSEHIHAKTLVRLATHLRETDQQQFMACLEEAARIIDRALLVINPLPEHRLEITGASRLFTDLRAEVSIAFADMENAEEAALEFFGQTGNQMGFVLVSRLLIGSAKEKDKGGLFKRAQDFINSSISKVEMAKKKPLPDLFLCRAELMIQWRLLGHKGDINWECLRDDLKATIDTPQFSRDPIWLFYLAVAYYHLKEYPAGDALFSALRQINMSTILRNPFRCFFVGPDGKPKTLQGTLESGGTHNRYIRSTELGTDVMARKGEFRQADHATVHFHIAFSVLGPLAVAHTVTDLKSLER